MKLLLALSVLNVIRSALDVKEIQKDVLSVCLVITYLKINVLLNAQVSIR